MLDVELHVVYYSSRRTTGSNYAIHIVDHLKGVENEDKDFWHGMKIRSFKLLDLPE